MKKTLLENVFVKEPLDHIRMLLALAEDKRESQGFPFKEEDYKWVLGANVISDLSKLAHYSYVVYPDCPRTVFGIIAEIDYQNPDNVQLWENITNKV